MNTFLAVDVLIDRALVTQPSVLLRSSPKRKLPAGAGPAWGGIGGDGLDAQGTTYDRMTLVWNSLVEDWKPLQALCRLCPKVAVLRTMHPIFGAFQILRCVWMPWLEGCRDLCEPSRI